MSRNSRKCVVCGKCEYGISYAKAFYTSFPLDESRCREWLRVVGDPELVFLPIEKLNRIKFICKDHFVKKDFNKKGNRLKKTAVPTCGLQQPPLTKEQLKEFPMHMWNYKKVPESEGVVSSEECTTSMIDKITTRKRQNEESLSETNIVTEIAVNKSISSPKRLKKEDRSDVITEATSAEPVIPREPLPGPSKIKDTKSSVCCTFSPRKKKLIQKLQKTKMTLKSLRKSANIIETLESTMLKELVKSASLNQKRSIKGRRWTTQNKISCLSIMKRSPKTYRYLRHLLPLPSVSTLQNIVKKIPMKTGINYAVINHLLKHNSNDNDSEKEKICAILYDEMAIKPRLIYNESTDEVDGFQDLGESLDGCSRNSFVADHALVLMMQGIYKKYKQPIGVYFVKGTISSEKLVSILKSVISAINATGYRVLATVCDQGPTNLGSIKLLKEFSGVAATENYFIVEGKKVFVIYDVPHLFKSIRNNFLKNGQIEFDGRVGKWNKLQIVERKNREMLYLSKFSSIHLNPKYRAKMKVKYAAQALSNTVAAVLKLLSEIEEHKDNITESEELLNTALVIQDLDRLFDLTNGPSGPEDIKKGIRQNVSKETDHIERWAEYEKKMLSMKFKNNEGNYSKNVKCVQGYVTTLRSLRDIWNEVSKLGFKYLNLRQLNQDSLENLFGLIRQHSPTNKNPTVSHFMAALKTSLINKLTAPHSSGSNCQKDNNELLTTFCDIIFQKEVTSSLDTESTRSQCQKDILPIVEDDIPVLSLNEYEDIEESLQTMDDAVVYVSGYLAFRLLKNNDVCEECKNNLTNNNPAEDSMYMYIKLREWWSNENTLTYPSKMLCEVVKCATASMESEICPILYTPNIGQLTVTVFTTVCSTDWFTCTDHKKPVFQMLFTLLGKLLIRRQCQRTNLSFASQEENLADAVKRAQQYGQAK